MSIDPDVDAYMSSEGGPPAFKFDAPGAVAKGRLIAARMQPVIDYVTKKPKLWPSGDPEQQLVITLRADDGEEFRVFCTYQCMKELKAAVVESGDPSMREGAEIAIKYDHDEPAKIGTQKIYKARYTQPSPVAVTADDF